MPTISASQITAFKTGLGNILNNLQTQLSAELYAENLPIVGAGLQNGTGKGLTKITALKTALDSSLGSLANDASAETVLGKVNEALGKAGFSKTAKLTGGDTFEVDFSDVKSVKDTEVSAALAGDAGLGKLGLQITGEESVAGTIGYDFNFRAGLQGEAYVESTGTNLVELQLTLNAGNGITTTGTMGFVPYDVSAPAGTKLLEATVGLALADADGRVTASEASGNFIAGSIVNGIATPVLTLTAAFGDNALLPKITSLLAVDWNLAGAELNSGDDNSTFGAQPTVVVNDVSLDVSVFLNAINDSFVTPTLDVAGPIFEICDKLSTPLPVVGDILARFGLGGTLIDIFAGPGSAAAESVKAISRFGNFLEDVKAMKGAGKIDLGTFSLGNADIRDPFFSLGAVQPGVLDFGGGVLGGALKTLGDAAAAIPGLAFPILQTQGEIFKMVLGQAANIVTYDAAPITFGVNQNISFPLFFGINGRVGFEANGQINLGLGYDTSGLVSFASTGDASDLADGFFLKDFGTQGAGEIPEAQFTAQITAGVGAGIPGIFEVGVEGGIRGAVNYDFADAFTAADRKLSYKELESVGFNPFAVADISGRIDAFLSFFVESLVYSKSKDLGAITLFDFDTARNAAQGFANAVLAAENGGELLIHTGSNAGLRGAGSTDVAESIRIEAAGGSLRVASPKAEDISDVELASLGAPGTFKGVSKIKAFGGAGQDVITLGALVKKPAFLDGGVDGDVLTGGAGADEMYGGDGSDRVIGGGGNDKLFGDLVVPGDAGAADVISGLDGNDTIEGGSGRDEIRGGSGSDTIYGYGRLFNQWIKNGDTGDDMYGGEGSDLLFGSNGNDVLDGGIGADVLFGAGGSDTFRVDNKLDLIFSDAPQNQIIESTAPLFKLPAGFQFLILTTRYDEETDVTFTDSISGEGNDGVNFLNGNNAANGLFGKGGNDFLYGLGGDDILLGGEGDDVLEGGNGDDFLFGENGNNTLRGGNGDDELHGGPGVDVLEGGQGDDVYYTDNIAEISDTGGRDAIASAVSVNLADNPSIEGVQLTGSADADATGTEGDNFLGGNAGRNHLRGLGGKDRLAGGAGDTLEGGFGGDTYIVDSEKAIVVEVNEVPSLLNSDVVLAKSSFTLPANVESLILIGAGAKSGNGNEEDNQINANGQVGVRAALGQALTLDGGGGNDAVSGGDGADKVSGGNGDDSVFGNAGDDILHGGRKTGSTTGGDEDELYGGTGDDRLFGGPGNDTLYGDKSVGGDDTGFPVGEGADLLDGGTGFDELFGGKGNDRLISDGDGDTLDGSDGDDTYVITGGVFVVSIRDSEGTDTIESFVDTDLQATFFGAPVITGDIENLTLTDAIAKAGKNFVAVGPSNASGNALANVITGNAVSNTIDGRGGNDRIIGGGGGDNLTGGTGDDALDGGEGDDFLNGGNFSDYDVLSGGTGSDRYEVFAYDEVVEEKSDPGTDTVLTTLDRFQLPLGVENLELASAGTFGLVSGPEKANGNFLNNRITGNGEDNEINASLGDDTVFGGDGEDTLLGGPGKDTLFGDDDGDTLDGGSGDDLLHGGAGIDFLRGGDGRDKLFGFSGALFGGPDDNTPDNLDGGSGDDTLDGGSGNDIISGGVGKDTMIGGTGDDLFFVDHASDKVIEDGSGGFDSVVAFTSFTIPQNVERLGLFGPEALIATGDGRNNVLIGGDGANTLKGLLGADTLVGWRGNDTLTGGDGEDILYGDEGTTVIVSADVSGFTGSGNDVLDGGTGSDTMHGQRGDDLYLVDIFSDNVIESSGEGVDTVRTTITGYTLPANVENLTYVATLNDAPNPAPGKPVFAASFYGNALPNIITAGLGDDYLDGYGGSDILIGGKGDDRYVVDTIADRIVERAKEGTDLVLSRADDFVLPDNVENLDIIGTHPLSIATGNALANVINGDVNSNAISGEGGNDQLFGGGGSDLLLGGDGNDILDGGAGADDMEGGNGDDTFHVNHATDTTQEAEGKGFDTVILDALLNYSVQVGQSIEKVIASEVAGQAAITGNAIANIIVGNSQGNTLSGGNGNDRLEGGGGDDSLQGADFTVRGTGELDSLAGGSGADFFYLGDISGVFYDDGNSNTPGKTDFALITDFKPAEGDKLAFFGQSTGIIAKATGVSANLGTGTKFYVGMGIYRDFDLDGVVDELGRAPDELVGIIHNFLGGGLDFADYSVFLQV